MDEAMNQRLTQLWTYVTNVIKKHIMSQTLWQAMETALPIGCEGNCIILGIGDADYHLATSLEQPAARSAIEQALSAAARKAVVYRVIPGKTEADWAEVQSREHMAREMLASPDAVLHKVQGVHEVGRNDEANNPTDWNSLITHAHRVFVSLKIKSVPQSRASYVMSMIEAASKAADRLTPGVIWDMDDRGLSRVLEKVGEMAEVDPAVVALEYYHYRKARLDAAAAAEPSFSPEAGGACEP